MLPNYLTPAGYDQLRHELEHLVKKERPEIVTVVSWAASNGDRSENGDYLYGKKRLREIDRRIRFLTQRLEKAQIVDPAQQHDHERIFFGATVKYLDPLGQAHTITLVGVDEAQPLLGKISWISPVAKALLKNRVGDVVTVQTPGGQEEIEILSIYHS